MTLPMRIVYMLTMKKPMKLICQKALSLLSVLRSLVPFKTFSTVHFIRILLIRKLKVLFVLRTRRGCLTHIKVAKTHLNQVPNLLIFAWYSDYLMPFFT